MFQLKTSRTMYDPAMTYQFRRTRFSRANSTVFPGRVESCKGKLDLVCLGVEVTNKNYWGFRESAVSADLCGIFHGGLYGIRLQCSFHSISKGDEFLWIHGKTLEDHAICYWIFDYMKPEHQVPFKCLNPPKSRCVCCLCRLGGGQPIVSCFMLLHKMFKVAILISEILFDIRVCDNHTNWQSPINR